MIVVGVVAALAAGASFAAGGVLQQQSAVEAPASDTLSVRLFRDVLRRPRWLIGVGLAVAAYGWQALALSAAPLALVQPLIVSELLFAIPASMWQRRLHLVARDWAAIVAVAGGLGVALAAAAPRNGTGSSGPLGWVLALGCTVGVAAALTLSGRSRHGVGRAALFAAGAAVLFAAGSACLAQFVQELSTHGIVAGLTSWPPYALTGFSLLAFLLIQSAFQAGPLAVVMPVSDVVEPLVAVLLGIAVLDEHIVATPGRLALLAAATVVLLAGIVVLDRSPNVHAEQRLDGIAGRGERGRSG